MLLTSIIHEYFSDLDYSIENEKDFSYLALIESNITEANCVFLDNQKHINTIPDSATMVITTKEIQPLLTEKFYGLCIVNDPRDFFFNIHNALSNNNNYTRKRFDNSIGEGCIISKLASIADKNITIGNKVTIEEFVVIRENTAIGDNTIIRAGAIIGGQGFEFKRTENNIKAVAHLGGVVIGNNVEIQYNTCVDRAVYPWDNTEIGDFSKIDNLVHVAHAVKVKENVLIVANCGIGGRTIIQNNAWIGFGSTLINGITIGENARANIGSVVTKDVVDNGSVTGNFAIEHNKFIRNLKKANEE